MSPDEYGTDCLPYDMMQREGAGYVPLRRGPLPPVLHFVLTEMKGHTIMEKLHFASDYMEGAHPLVLEALNRTNLVSTPGYGEDDYCRDAEKRILEACGCPGGEVRFLVGGTQANQFAIDCMLAPWQGVLCAASGHIAVHEAGAVEFTGRKVMPLPAVQGKITAEQIRQTMADYLADDNHEHMVEPGMVYLSQPTEYGTVYGLAELEAISLACRETGLFLYVDGARLAYSLAVPGNDVTLPDLARLCDLFYIGGTKCGLLFGEALVCTRKGLIPHLTAQIKQHGALLAKGRLLGVQFQALFTDDLYLKLGECAIRSADRIRACLKENGFTLSVDSPTNQVFFTAENDYIRKLADKVEYGFMEKVDEDHSMIRFCTSWSTTDEQTDRLLELISSL